MPSANIKFFDDPSGVYYESNNEREPWLFHASKIHYKASNIPSDSDAVTNKGLYDINKLVIQSEDTDIIFDIPTDKKFKFNKGDVAIDGNLTVDTDITGADSQFSNSIINNSLTVSDINLQNKLYLPTTEGFNIYGDIKLSGNLSIQGIQGSSGGGGGLLDTTINATPIGETTPAIAIFTDVSINNLNILENITVTDTVYVNKNIILKNIELPTITYHTFENFQISLFETEYDFTIKDSATDTIYNMETDKFYLTKKPYNEIVFTSLNSVWYINFECVNSDLSSLFVVTGNNGKEDNSGNTYYSGNFDINVLGNFDELTINYGVLDNNVITFTGSINSVFIYKRDINLADHIVTIDNSINTLLVSDFESNFSDVTIQDTLSVVTGKTTLQILEATDVSFANLNVSENLNVLQDLNVLENTVLQGRLDALDASFSNVDILENLNVLLDLTVAGDLNGTLTTPAQTNITSIGTLSSLTVAGDLNGTLTTPAQTNITSVGTLSSLTVTGDLNGTLTTPAQTNITSIGTLSSLTVAGDLSGTLTTPAQTNITSVGTLSDLTVAGDLNGTLTTSAQTNITSVGTLSSLNVTGNIHCTNMSGTLTTSAQTNIESVGTLSSLTVTGDLNGTLTTPAQTNITSVGTLSSLNVAGNLNGTLTTQSQPNIESVGTLSSLTVTGDLNGTLTTPAQTNITSVGTLSSLTVAGDLNVLQDLNVTLDTVLQGRLDAVDASFANVGISQNLNILQDLNVTLDTVLQGRLDAVDASFANVDMNGDLTVIGNITGQGDVDINNTKITSVTSGTTTTTEFTNNQISGTNGSVFKIESVNANGKWIGMSCQNKNFLFSYNNVLSLQADNLTSSGTITGGTITSSGTITSTGTLSASSGTGSLHTLGKVKIGQVGTTDRATFAHKDHATSVDYALAHGSDGSTFLCSGVDKTITFKTATSSTGNVDWMSGSNTGVTVTTSGDIKLTCGGIGNKISFYSGSTAMFNMRLSFVYPKIVPRLCWNDGDTSITGSENFSDDRLKHNEVDIVNGLDLIRQLVPQFYQKTQDLKDADYIGDLSDGTWKWESGFIAQEVLQIADLSYCVEGGDYIDESGNTVAAPHTLNYNNIFTYACAGLKELDQIVQTEIIFLKQENTDLSNNVNLLQQENASMKTTIETLKSALNELLAAAGKPTI